MRAVELTCQVQRCWSSHIYQLNELALTLYTHGICTVVFTCRGCGRRSEFGVPDRVALDLDRQGVPSTIVRTPEEVFEWPARAPAIGLHDVGVLERSTLEHFNDCARRELSDGRDADMAGG